MSTRQNIALRDARDRLSEVLELGLPFPLRDIPVLELELTVPFNDMASIAISFSQLGVLYQLHKPNNELETRTDDEGNQISVEVEGTGDVIYLNTPPITENISYNIHAIKVASQRKAYLHSQVTVRVGLDTRLTAMISSHPPLDALADNVLNTDPRICEYSDTLEVTMPSSQEGVDYRLVHFVEEEGTGVKEIELSDADVRGTGNLIVLRSKAVLEDTTIRIRATKKFEVPENRVDQELLEIQLPVAVKANPNLGVSLTAAVVDFQSQAESHIENTQHSAQYRVYARRVRDPEIIHGTTDKQVLKVIQDQEPEVQILHPDIPDVWAPVSGFNPMTDFHTGTGGRLTVAIDKVTDDCVLIVEAIKHHQFNETVKIASSVWLSQPVALLTRPDPEPELSLRVVMQGNTTDGRLQVELGQPGVFYFFRTATNGGHLPQPAYIYQRDEQSSTMNKGLDQLEVGIDLVVAADPSTQALETEPDPARRAPVPPILESGPLNVGSKLYVRAVKAQTQIAAKLTHSATITAMPEVRLTQPGVSSGQSVSIEIIASLPGDHYVLMLDGEAVKPAVTGDGSNLSIETAAIVKDSEFHLQASRSGDNGLPVLRVVPIWVLLNPDTNLVVSAANSEVAVNGTTQIRVQSSQIGVDYQLLVEGQETGEVVSGDGGEIHLPTPPLTADTTFTVRAVRQIDTTVVVNLSQQVTVTVQTL